MMFESESMQTCAAQASERVFKNLPERVLRGSYELLKRRMRGRPLWSFVGEVSGHGSGYSQEICRSLGWDPDMKVGNDLPPWSTSI